MSSTPTAPSPAQISAAVEEMKEEINAMLAGLVRIDSTLGRDEAAAQAFMQAAFKALDAPLTVERFTMSRQEIENVRGFSPVDWQYGDGKDNVVATFKSAANKVPTGPLTDWTNPPFQPVIKDGRLYGRGAGDMKAGVVAFYMAFKALLKMGYVPASDVCMQTVIEEECTGNGALDLWRRYSLVVARYSGEALFWGYVMGSNTALRVILEIICRPVIAGTATLAAATTALFTPSFFLAGVQFVVVGGLIGGALSVVPVFVLGSGGVFVAAGAYHSYVAAKRLVAKGLANLQGTHGATPSGADACECDDACSPAQPAASAPPNALPPALEGTVDSHASPPPAHAHYYPAPSYSSASTRKRPSSRAHCPEAPGPASSSQRRL